MSELEELVRGVKNGLLEEGSATFDEVRVIWVRCQSPGATAVALGALEARGEVGYDGKHCYVPVEKATSKAARPSLCADVLEVLNEHGQSTFLEITDRVNCGDPVEVGLAIGWLYGEGEITDSADGYWYKIGK